jgi:hypothetical protein
MAADWGYCVDHTYHANFWLAEMSKNSHQNNSSISLSHTHTIQISCMITKIDECLPTCRRKNWPQKVSRLRTRVGSPDTVYRSVYNKGWIVRKKQLICELRSHYDMVSIKLRVLISRKAVEKLLLYRKDYFLKRFCCDVESEKGPLVADANFTVRPK